MSGRPGANSRGRGGKFKKFTRGGGKHFSRDLRPLDAEGNEVSMWSEEAQHRQADDEDDEEEESSEEEDDDNDSPAAGLSQTAPLMSREERKKQKALRKVDAIAKVKGKEVQVGDMPPSSSEDEDVDDDDDMPANPNHSKAAQNQASRAVDGQVQDMSLNNAAPSRREQEFLQAQQAKEQYMKLHMQGKTEEAKIDMARLKIIREQREAAAAFKRAEKEEKEQRDKARRAEIEAKEAKKREAALGKKKGAKITK